MEKQRHRLELSYYEIMIDLLTVYFWGGLAILPTLRRREFSRITMQPACPLDYGGVLLQFVEPMGGFDENNKV